MLCFSRKKLEKQAFAKYNFIVKFLLYFYFCLCISMLFSVYFCTYFPVFTAFLLAFFKFCLWIFILALIISYELKYLACLKKYNSLGAPLEISIKFMIVFHRALFDFMGAWRILHFRTCYMYVYVSDWACDCIRVYWQ